MATLVLSTIGTVLGGPVGGAIGSMLGQSIDQQLFGPGPRQGPRLGDLSVQTSSYGTPIAQLFGTMRVAGSVIWSTDLQEDSETSGAKGQPDAVTYSYSASFAVALSSRRIQDIGRIWADGKLIRTADGQFTVATGFRFHEGTEDQPVDPLIATIEGLDLAPAYRGTAIAVFEHLQLAGFGNRIPFLTFEVVADGGPVDASAILEAVSSGAIAAATSTSIDGYAAYGASIRSAVEPLVEMLAIPLLDDGSALVTPPVVAIAAEDSELGCSAGADRAERLQRSQTSARDLPSALSLTYHDPQRDYQSGLARASMHEALGASAAVELPAVLEAGEAKALAESLIARRWAKRDRLTLRLPPNHLGLKPGSVVVPAFDPQNWVAEKVTVDSLVIIAELRPVYSSFAALPADPGRALPSLGVVPVPTVVSLVELPDDGKGEADAPVIAVATSSGSASWRPVPLQVQIGSDTYSISSSAVASIQGFAETALPAGQAALIDDANSVEIELTNADDWIESADDPALVDGANLALLGHELVQFGEAVALGPKRFRLSRLLRGRRGTEWAMGDHQAGERFVLIDPRQLRRIEVNSAMAGAEVSVTPRGLGDANAAAVSSIVTGEAMRPPSPAHLRASLRAGILHCSWIRRSSRGWAWLDGVDAPLGSSTEFYRVTLRGSNRDRVVETSTTGLEVQATELADLGSPELHVAVVQVGDYAASRPAELTIIID